MTPLPGPCRVVYEAGSAGFGLARALTAASIGCVVPAPSKLHRPAGVRVKTDVRDAMLARLLRLDEITPVRVPTIEQESARDLVRAREDVRGDLMRARHRLSKLLLRHGIVYSAGKAWTGAHDAWLRRQGPVLATGPLRLTFDADYETVLTVTARFTSATIGSYLGLVPTEASSGASRVRGSITETGNGHARRLLVEAAWHRRKTYRAGSTLRNRWQAAPAVVVARADTGNGRLHARWRRFDARAKRPVIANVAVARELAGWCWSLATM